MTLSLVKRGPKRTCLLKQMRGTKPAGVLPPSFRAHLCPSSSSSLYFRLNPACRFLSLQTPAPPPMLTAAIAPQQASLPQPASSMTQTWFYLNCKTPGFKTSKQADFLVVRRSHAVQLGRARWTLGEGCRTVAYRWGGFRFPLLPDFTWKLHVTAELQARSCSLTGYNPGQWEGHSDKAWRPRELCVLSLEESREGQ